MWNRIAVVSLTIVIAVAGCRTPQSVLPSLQRSDPCFQSTAPEISNPVVNSSETGSIEEYVQLGLQRNPQITAAQHAVAAAGHRIPQALSLPDPMVSTNTFLAPVQTAAGEQAFSLGISQKYTDAERRATQAAIVSEEVALAKSQLAQTKLDIAASIRTACYQLLFIRKSIEITNDDRESLENIAEVVLRQYEVKQSVTQQDVLNIQTEQSKLENQIRELRQQEKSYQARLARLLHLAPESALQIVDSLDPDNAALDIDALIAQASAARPDLNSQLADVRRARKQLHLARLADRPDFTVGLNWIATSTNGISPVANGDDALLLGVGFNLPVYQSRIRAGICEAQSNRLGSASRLSALQARAGEEIFDLVAKLESTRETLALIQEDILPKADRTLELSIDEYATDSVTYVQLIENWRSALRYRITEANLQSQYQQLLASLAQSVGQVEPLKVSPIDESPIDAPPTDESPTASGTPQAGRDEQP